MDTLLTEAIGIIATIISISSLLPQAIKSFRTEDMSAVSLPSFLLLLISAVLWLIYGIRLNAFSMIVANAVMILCSAGIIYNKLRK